MGSFQKFRGNPEQKLFFLLNNFMGGINTEFSDDNSNDVDFESIINFNMDRLGTLNKRGGFGELNAISEIFNKLDVETELPNIKNRTKLTPNPENENDNVVYMKLLRNDNKCFRALSAFSGEKAYRKYQELYGFQDNKFELLMITTKLEDNVEISSTAWLYKCELPELEYDEHGEPTLTDTAVMTCNKYQLPLIFKWDRNLMNIDTIEFYDKIYFTDNNKGLLSFDRSVEVTDDTSFASAFSISGVVGERETNSAYIPSGLEIRHIGFNVLATDPLHSIDTQSLTTDSIQGIYVCTVDNIPLQNLPLGQKFLLNIIYTGEDNGFNIEIKEGENALSFDVLANETLSRAGLKVYDVTFKAAPNKEVEIKITKNNATLEPYYDYYNVEQVDAEAKPVEQLNVGDYGLCEMYNRAVFYKDDTIWFSEVNNFNYIPNYNYVTLPIEPTDRITKICYFKKAYIVFTKERIYKMVNAFGASNFAVQPVNLSLGCHAGNTVTPIEDTLYFASPRGLYALKSNTFLEGYENVRELDLKVKKLTSDFTKYDEELTNPAVRFNGINERAYATRYKDKYLLFYNNYNDKGDYAAVNDLDVLAYQFDLNAYTTYRFEEKPTFLFMVDNAIETLATVKQKEIFTDEQVLFDYNLNELNGNIVTDNSGNNNDAIVQGDISVNKGAGITLNDNPGYVDMGAITNNIKNGFTINLDTKLDTLNGANLVTIKQSSATSANIDGSISTSELTGYKARLDYTIIPNNVTGNDTVNYKVYLIKTIEDAVTSGTISSYTLKEVDSSDYLKSATNINFDFGSSNEIMVDSGTFKISRDNTFNYSKTWYFTMYIRYMVTTTTTQTVFGNDVVLDNTFFDTSKSWIDVGFTKFKATATSSGCTISYTPAVKNSARLNIGSRSMYVYIDGVTHWHTIGSINSSSAITEGEPETIYINYSGNHTISLDMEYAIKATLSGSYVSSISTSDTQYIDMPSVTTVTETTTTPKSVYLTVRQAINLVPTTTSYREIVLKQKDSKDQLEFILTSENGTYNLLTHESAGLRERHNWSIVVEQATTGYLCSIIRDGTTIASSAINENMIINSNRDYCCLGTDNKSLLNTTPYMKGDIYKFNLTTPSETLLNFTFSEGTGTTTADLSGNTTSANLVGDIDWIIIEGLAFNGTNTYLQLPSFPAETFFSNGFKIEFEGVVGSNTNIARIIDLATSYNNDNVSNKKCSINIGVKNNLMSFNTTSNNFITYRATNPNLNLNEKHSYVVDCINNGGKNYDISLYVDNTLVSTTRFNYGGISDVNRNSNFIGRSNTTTENYFNGVLNSFKFTVYASTSGVSLYRSALYEFDTTSTDFGQPMYIELKTKGINMKYPQHLKKLKHIFVKAIGGYNYGEFFFTLYGDGYVVNDPRVYDYYLDEKGTIVQDYTDVKDLTIDERISLLGNMRLDYTKLGEGKYQVRKLIIPDKARNFTIFIYGESSDYLSIESFGFVHKLGKVKEG